MSSVRPVHTLLILGNGFDLNCGLDSSVDDFMNVAMYPHKYYNPYFKNVRSPYVTSNEASKYENDILINLKQIRKGFHYISQGVHYRHEKDMGITQIDNGKTFNWIIKSYKGLNGSFYNFWMYYLEVLKGVNVPTKHISWEDIEGQISFLCRRYDEYSSKKLFKDKDGNPISVIYLFYKYLYDPNKYLNLQDKDVSLYDCLDEFIYAIPHKKAYHANRFIVIAIIIAFAYCGLSNYINYENKDENNDYDQMFYDFLFKQLQDFSIRFSKYLSKNITKNNKYNDKNSYNYKKELGLNKLCKNPYNLLTFNYTGKPKDKKCRMYLPIHSDLNNHPIIGINDNECSDKQGHDRKFAEFSKENQISIYGNHNLTLKDIIPNDVKCIKIYGHSLSNDDFLYFKYIFNHCNLKKNDIKIIFYYTNYDKSSDHRVRFSRLVHKYMDLYNRNIRIYLMENHDLDIRAIDW